MEPLLNFDDAIATARVVDQVPVVHEEVRVRPVPSAEAGHMLVGDAEWGWRELRDYVVSEIEVRFGAFPREQHKEKAIFEGFLKRWGVLAVPIARFAFGTCEGLWRNAPVSVNRFCRGSDPYFSVRIAERLSS